MAFAVGIAALVAAWLAAPTRFGPVHPTWSGSGSRPRSRPRSRPSRRRASNGERRARPWRCSPWSASSASRWDGPGSRMPASTGRSWPRSRPERVTMAGHPAHGSVGRRLRLVGGGRRQLGGVRTGAWPASASPSGSAASEDFPAGRSAATGCCSKARSRSPTMPGFADVLHHKGIAVSQPAQRRSSALGGAIEPVPARHAGVPLVRRAPDRPAVPAEGGGAAARPRAGRRLAARSRARARLPRDRARPPAGGVRARTSRWCWRPCWRSRWAGSRAVAAVPALALGTVAFFVVLTGAEPSVMRAGVMASLDADRAC